MGNYVAYPAYKDSGVEWLGEIPQHWDSVALRWISKRYSGGTPDKKNDDFWYEGTIPWLNSGAVNQQVITKPSAYITIEAFNNSSAKWVPKGAILIALAGQGKTKGMTAFTTFPTTCNQSMAAVVFEEYDSKFMFWWLTSQYRNIRGLASDDARDGLNLEMIGSIPCPILDKSEQQQIANFLDDKTAHLDKLIGQKQQMIGLLNEKRMALITQAVTKGLDLTVPMKYSGVEWLGDVPEHWVVSRAKFVSSIFVPQRNKPETNEFEGVAWVTMDDMKPDYIASTRLKVSYQSALDAGTKVLKKGAVIASCIGNFGVVSINLVDVIINQQLQAFIPNDIQKEYLRNLVLISKQYFESIGTEATIIYVNQYGFENMPISLPPPNEQLQIANYLDTETQKIDNMIKTVKQAIATLQEYRTALITAAVTGKIDVRDLKPPTH